MKNREPLMANKQILWLVVGALAVGCNSSSDTNDQKTIHRLAAQLEESFPNHAQEVLNHEQSFTVTESAFVLKSPGAMGSFRDVEARFPRSGQDAIRFRMSSGEEIAIHEVGASGTGEIVADTVAYSRKGTTSFWAAIPGGYEEWLHIKKGSETGAASAISWKLEGAVARQNGENVDVLDGAGIVRISVSAPAAYAQSGEEIKVHLRASDDEIDLIVDGGFVCW